MSNETITHYLVKKMDDEKTLWPKI